MAIPTLQTYGGPLLAAGYPGQIADSGIQTVIRSFINDQAAAIDFGIAVARSTATAAGATDKCKQITADGDVIIGISVRNAAPLVANSSNAVTYAQFTPVPVVTFGVIFVTAAETGVVEGAIALSLTAGNGTVGAVGGAGGGAGAGRIVIPGAIWLDTTASGAIGRVRINNSTT